MKTRSNGITLALMVASLLGGTVALAQQVNGGADRNKEDRQASDVQVGKNGAYADGLVDGYRAGVRDEALNAAAGLISDGIDEFVRAFSGREKETNVVDAIIGLNDAIELGKKIDGNIEVPAIIDVPAAPASPAAAPAAVTEVPAAPSEARDHDHGFDLRGSDAVDGSGIDTHDFDGNDSDFDGHDADTGEMPA